MLNLNSRIAIYNSVMLPNYRIYTFNTIQPRIVPFLIFQTEVVTLKNAHARTHTNAHTIDDKCCTLVEV